jgi:hypothetical protein
MSAAAPQENGDWDGGFDSEEEEGEENAAEGGGQWGELASQAAAKAKQRGQVGWTRNCRCLF